MCKHGTLLGVTDPAFLDERLDKGSYACRGNLGTLVLLWETLTMCVCCIGRDSPRTRNATRVSSRCPYRRSPRPRISMQQMANAYTSVAFDRFTAPSSNSGACQRSVPSIKPQSKKGLKGNEINILAIGFLLLLDASHFILLNPKSEITHRPSPSTVQHIRSLHIHTQTQHKTR
jgi:hypothetical protein